MPSVPPPPPPPPRAPPPAVTTPPRRHAQFMKLYTNMGCELGLVAVFTVVRCLFEIVMVASFARLAVWANRNGGTRNLFIYFSFIAGLLALQVSRTLVCLAAGGSGGFCTGLWYGVINIFLGGMVPGWIWCVGEGRSVPFEASPESTPPPPLRPPHTSTLLMYKRATLDVHTHVDLGGLLEEEDDNERVTISTDDREAEAARGTHTALTTVFDRVLQSTGLPIRRRDSFFGQSSLLHDDPYLVRSDGVQAALRVQPLFVAEHRMDLVPPEADGGGGGGKGAEA